MVEGFRTLVDVDITTKLVLRKRKESWLIMSGEMDQNEEDLGTTVAIEMFGIDMVRETILDYAIHDKKGKICLDVVLNVRLVQKSWLDATNRVLQKSGGPVITLKLDETNSLTEADDVKENGKLLDQYVTKFDAATQLIHSRIPVKLVLTLAFFREENFISLLDFFTRCGNDLKELEVIFPKNGGSMAVCFPQFTLSVLRKVTFHFSDKIYLSNLADGETALPNFGDNRNGLWFLQAVLNASKELKSLDIPFISGAIVITIPDGFEYLQLPATIMLLDFSVKMKSKHLQVLLLNQLPNLNRLTLFVHGTPFVEGLLFQILHQFRKTLTSFEVGGLQGSGRMLPHTFLRFPLMEKLKSLVIWSAECELGPGDLSALPRCLPNLTRLILWSSVKIIETNWIANSKFEKVNELRICCKSEHFPYGHDNYFRSPSVGIMPQMHAAFPNIRRLSLTVNISDMSGLTYLLQNMTQLQFLCINLQGNLQDIGTSSDKLDSVLLGLPLKLVNVLREHGEHLESVGLRREHLQGSVRNLAELQTFNLWTDAKYDADAGGASLISALLFSQGFLKMPKLSKLGLHPIFKLSPEMEAQWKEQGLSFCYLKV